TGVYGTSDTVGVEGVATNEFGYGLYGVNTLGGDALVTQGNGSIRGDLEVTGTASAQAFNTTSDRNAKANFRPVDASDILAKVDALPITTWNFRTDASVRHLGPVAQDFRAAFGLGIDDK